MKDDRERDQAGSGRFPAFESILANNDVLDFRIIDFGHVQRLVMGRSFVQQLFDLVRAGFVAQIRDEREAIENEAGHTSLLPILFLPSYIPTTIAGMAFRPFSVSKCRGRV